MADARADGKRTLQSTASRVVSGFQGPTEEGKPEAGQKNPSRREGQGTGTRGARAVSAQHWGLLGA